MSQQEQPQSAPDDTFVQAAKAVDDAVAATAEWPAEQADGAQRLKAAIEGFHRPVLTKFVQAMRADPAAKAVLFELVEDPHVHALLAMHGIIKAPDAPPADAVTTVIPIESIKVRNRASKGWLAGPPADDIKRDDTYRFDITIGDELTFVLFTNVNGEISAFRNACVHQGLTLDGSRVVDGVLTCPWHGFTFDAVSGECISAPGAQLERFQCRVEDGKVWFKP